MNITSINMDFQLQRECDRYSTKRVDQLNRDRRICNYADRRWSYFIIATTPALRWKPSSIEMSKCSVFCKPTREWAPLVHGCVRYLPSDWAFPCHKQNRRLSVTETPPKRPIHPNSFYMRLIFQASSSKFVAWSESCTPTLTRYSYGRPILHAWHDKHTVPYWWFIGWPLLLRLIIIPRGILQVRDERTLFRSLPE